VVSQRQGVNGVCLILYENGPEEHWHDQPPKASAVPDNVREPSSSVDVSVRQQGTHVNHHFFINLFAREGVGEESPDL
jgi:hypothetical protein